MPDYTAIVSLIQFFDQFDSIPLFALGIAMAWYLNLSIKNHRHQIEMKHPSKKDFDTLEETINNATQNIADTKESIASIATQNAVIQTEIKHIKETLNK